MTDDRRKELIEMLGVCSNPKCRAHDRLLATVDRELSFRDDIIAKESMRDANARQTGDAGHQDRKPSA